MARHSNATPHSATSHNQTLNQQPLAEQTSATRNKTRHVIDASLKRRARRLISNSSIPKQTRSLILYALQIKDPHLSQLVRRVESGEITIDRLYPE